MTDKKEDQNKLIEERRNKLTALRKSGFNFPKSTAISSFSKDLNDEFENPQKKNWKHSTKRLLLPAG